MLPIVSWRVWMTDGSVFESTGHAWADVPSPGVAALCVYHNPAPYRTLMYGEDAYSLEPFRAGFAAFPEEGSAEKLGSWMSDENWSALLATINDDGSRP